ncbi:hypothetical protein M0R72_12260 [Candidatus Pacearchaeota archaeon]|nr:hypothetical protein [Candidatus Pacearchaeota archaeon]
MARWKCCKQCGRKVDLRKKGSFEIAPEIARYIPNKDYHYICSTKCHEAWKASRGW